MSLELAALFPRPAETARGLLACNRHTEPFGLRLTEAQALALAETHDRALQSSGRLEFGGSALEKLLQVFCASPYLAPDHYAETLGELTELFYSYKTETVDRVGDEDLLSIMYEAFNGPCQGSLERLQQHLEELVRTLRSGRTPDVDEEEDPYD